MLVAYCEYWMSYASSQVQRQVAVEEGSDMIRAVASYYEDKGSDLWIHSISITPLMTPSSTAKLVAGVFRSNNGRSERD